MGLSNANLSFLYVKSALNLDGEDPQFTFNAGPDSGRLYM